MSELDNIPKLEAKVDLTEVTNNAYNDTLQKPLKSGSSAITTVLDFFHNTVLYPMQRYNIYAKNKLTNYATELENKAKHIPEKNLIPARVNILGPTIDGLKYNLDEEHIKEMFTNILISDMDNRKQNKVLPAYIEIVKQLSKDDAEMLKFFKEKKIKNNPIIKLKYNLVNGGFIYVSNNIGLIYNNEDIVLDSIILDNLVRLKLIDLNFNEYRNDTSIYEKVFEKIQQRDEFKNLGSNVKDLGFSKGLIKLTDFGQNFIDICLS